MRRFLVPFAAACLLLPAAPAEAIVGGQDAPAGKYPYVVSVNIAGSASCTGSLIAPTWVMTAGHCVSVTGLGGVPLPVTLPASSFEVTIGTNNTDGKGGDTRSVKSVHVDPNYAATNGTGSDVGLLELTEPTTLAPVKIAAPSEAGIWEPGDILTIAGFGTLTEGGDPPAKLQEATVPRVSDEECSQDYDDTTPVVGNAFDPKTALCAGKREGGTDTCQGDSGGPLLAPLGDTFRLVGSTSYGEGCARERRPGVYARVAEGTVKDFVVGLVPDAVAAGNPSENPSPGPSPSPSPTPAPSTESCAGTKGLAIVIRKPKTGKLRRVRVLVGKVVVLKRSGKSIKRLKVQLADKLPKSGTATVTVVSYRFKHIRRTTTRTYTACVKKSTKTKVKRIKAA